MNLLKILKCMYTTIAILKTTKKNKQTKTQNKTRIKINNIQRQMDGFTGEVRQKAQITARLKV